MKIVEFGDDGKPRFLQQSGPQQPGSASQDRNGVKIREFSGTASANAPVETGRIKIREFGIEADDAYARKSSGSKPGLFGAARVPETIKIVDFDKEKGRSQAKPGPAAERPRGIKIVETE